MGWDGCGHVLGHGRMTYPVTLSLEWTGGGYGEPPLSAAQDTSIGSAGGSCYPERSGREQPCYARYREYGNATVEI